MPSKEEDTGSSHWTSAASQLDDEDIWLTLCASEQRQQEHNSSSVASSSSSPSSSLTAVAHGLHDWERHLRCLICQDFYTAPVSVAPCHHVFCSACIRHFISSAKTSIRRQAHCPVCKEEVNFTSLVPNRALEEITRTFQAMREPLKCVLFRNKQLSVTEERGDEPVGANLEQNAVNSSQSLYEASGERSASAHVRTTSADRKSSCRLPKKPTLMYKNLKRKQLVAECAKEGLNTSGSDKELIARHKEFITLYQAERDSFYPRSVAELVQEVHARERARQREAIKQRFEQRQYHADPDLGGGGGGTATLSESKVSVKDPGFAKLIQQANERRRKKPQDVPGGGASEDIQKSYNASGKDSPTALQPLKEQQEAISQDETATVKKRIEEATDGAVADPSEQMFLPSSSSLSQRNQLSPEWHDEEQTDYAARPTGEIPQVEASKRRRLSAQDEVDGKENWSAETSSSASTKHGTEVMNSVDIRMPNETMRTPKISARTERNNTASASATTSTTSSLHAPWTCSKCTFINHNRWWMDAKCEICNCSRNQDSTNANEATNTSSSSSAVHPETIAIDL